LIQPGAFQMHIKPNAPRFPLFTAEAATPADTVTFQFEDQVITAPAGISVAAALLLSGVGPFRATPVTSAPRAAYCMMGVCFECLVEIDGRPSRQSCLTQVRQGMTVRRQDGASAPVRINEGKSHGK
jgi:predicted molibdopterin-dependent oxidoreductase YjgC